MDTPRIIEASHVDARVLFRSKTLKEGIIQELSPSQTSVRISSTWYENKAGLVVEILPDLPNVEVSGKPKRFKPSL